MSIRINISEAISELMSPLISLVATSLFVAGIVKIIDRFVEEKTGKTYAMKLISQLDISKILGNTETIRALDERIAELESAIKKKLVEIGVPPTAAEKALEWAKDWSRRVTKVKGTEGEIVWRLNYIGALEEGMPLKWLIGIYKIFLPPEARRLLEEELRRVAPR